MKSGQDFSAGVARYAQLEAGQAGWLLGGAAHRLGAMRPGVVEADAEAVCIGVRLGRADMGAAEGGESSRAVGAALAVEAEPDEALDDCLERRLGPDMALQP